MKKIILWSIFLFVSTVVFGQLPSAVIHEFESRTRDIHEDDLLTVSMMFTDFLAAERTVNVVESANNAEYSVHGLMTQLGTSITFNITLRDNTTSSVLSTVQMQYTLENIWDNSIGIPGQLTEMANSIAIAINTEHNRRQQVIQAELARLEAERQAELARLEGIRRAEEAEIQRQQEAIRLEEQRRLAEERRLQQEEERRQQAAAERHRAETFDITGNWFLTNPPQGVSGQSSILFNANGTFTIFEESEGRSNNQSWTSRTEGRYTRNGPQIILSGTTTRRTTNHNTRRDTTSQSNFNRTLTIDFSFWNVLRISGGMGSSEGSWYRR